MHFKRNKASKASISKRKPLYGVGINDADYITSPSVNGKRYTCKVYVKWKNMIVRAYSKKSIESRPTYTDVSVCDEWLTFSNFSQWYLENAVSGFDLDKDIKIKGNKVYGPDTCLFVPRAINGLLNNHSAARGSCPLGVCFSNAHGRYLAQISIDSSLIKLGTFSTKQEAEIAYKTEKNKEIRRKCKQYPEFSEYLINHLL